MGHSCNAEPNTVDRSTPNARASALKRDSLQGSTVVRCWLALSAEDQRPVSLAGKDRWRNWARLEYVEVQ